MSQQPSRSKHNYFESLGSIRPRGSALKDISVLQPKNLPETVVPIIFGEAVSLLFPSSSSTSFLSLPPFVQFPARSDLTHFHPVCLSDRPTALPTSARRPSFPSLHYYRRYEANYGRAGRATGGRGEQKDVERKKGRKKKERK